MGMMADAGSYCHHEPGKKCLHLCLHLGIFFTIGKPQCKYMNKVDKSTSEGKIRTWVE